MLQNEFRRLREGDLVKMRERNKRLEWKKKMEILRKEREQWDFQKHIKEAEYQIQKKKT